MPLAGEFSATAASARAALVYPLTWVECDDCELVQVLEDISDDVLFKTYNYSSSTVGGLVRHFAAYADWLVSRYGAAPRRVLEIGCNDGVLLRQLPNSWTRVGVDPSDVAARATRDGYELVNQPFTHALGASSEFRESFDLITGSNCLGHISDLADVFRGANAALRPGGDLVVEVHDLDVTLATAQWDTIYHEHKAEWSDRALARCLAPLGFSMVAKERLALHGGLIRAVFRKGKPETLGRHARKNSFEALTHAYRDRRSTATYRRLNDAVEQGRSIAAYGAAGRANVWLNQLSELPFRYIVDESPLRAGKWIPRVATPIVGREHLNSDPPDACVVTAWNYAADIRAKNDSYRGEWLQTFTDD
jgi:SAM-dependent methyltransferase